MTLFEAKSDIEDLAVSNPNHLKQFLEVGHDGKFKDFDLESLRILF